MIIEYVHTRNKNSNSERDVPQCGDRRKKINVKVIRDKEKKKREKKKKKLTYIHISYHKIITFVTFLIIFLSIGLNAVVIQSSQKFRIT